MEPSSDGLKVILLELVLNKSRQCLASFGYCVPKHLPLMWSHLAGATHSLPIGRLLKLYSNQGVAALYPKEIEVEVVCKVIWAEYIHIRE